VNITEVRIKLTEDPKSKLRAYCSVTFDDAFVVRDLKVIEGARGPFVAMPSRKLSDRCPRCSAKNNLQAHYCQNCGVRLPTNRAPRDEAGRSRLHADLAHPINAACRVALHRAVVKAFTEEVDRSKVAGYVPPSFDDLDELQERAYDDYFDDLARRHQERLGLREGNSGEARATEQ
jgi:stage V sporulation protein G